jgi:hypothetical protein
MTYHFFSYLHFLPCHLRLPLTPPKHMKHVVVICACVAFAIACTKKEQKQPEPAPEVAPVAVSTPQPTEIADHKYIEMGKKDIAALNANDLDAYMNSFAGNARYYFSGGDSLIGKEAISTFWKKRFATVVDKAVFSNDVWTPLKVNQSQQRQDIPGVWLLSWYRVNVKYKNGQKLAYWVHTDLHYDAMDKIDIAILYMDRAPINKALAMK